MNPRPQPGFPDEPWLAELVRRSLVEDLGTGDVSTELAVPPQARAAGRIVARREGVVAGLPLVERVYRALSADVTCTVLRPDGSSVATGEIVARLEGPAAALLSGERTALNFLQHLSGIASLCALYVSAVAGTACQILDTRKTLPGFRALAKYAVRCGGGRNHRQGLYDRIMFKDNHWAAAGGHLAELVAAARRRYPALAVEVEVDSLEQLDRVLPLGVEWILLDNFTPAMVAEAVSRRDGMTADWGSTLLEASGNVSLDNVRAYAAAGVDAVSVGRLTHSAPALDLSLELQTVPPDDKERDK
jgi:nicotinate-nucleotide pyrophosphorylase (carboxylating)